MEPPANDLRPLIEAAELGSILASPDAPHRPPLVLLDARPDAAAFAEQHLPGAHHAALEAHLSSIGCSSPDVADPANGGRHPLPRREMFARQLGAWGVTQHCRVVVYDGAGGEMAAARCWWMLRAGGHRWVQVLDGGLAAARAADLLTQRRLAPIAPPAEPYPLADWSGHTVPLEAVVDVSRAAAAPLPPPATESTVTEATTASSIAATPGPPSPAVLLDARSAQRFRGEGDPYDPVSGHIPGSRSAPYAEALRADGRFRPAEEVRQWLLQQITASASSPVPEEVIVTCGSGVTACHLALAMEHAGLAPPKVYIGSWSEWCRHSELPVGRATAKSEESSAAPT